MFWKNNTCVGLLILLARSERTGSHPKKCAKGSPPYAPTDKNTIMDQYGCHRGHQDGWNKVKWKHDPDSPLDFLQLHHLGEYNQSESLREKTVACIDALWMETPFSYKRYSTTVYAGLSLRDAVNALGFSLQILHPPRGLRCGLHRGSK